MSKFRPIDRDTPMPLPSVQELLPKGHLARYIVEVVEGLDLSGLTEAYSGRGSPPYHPALLLALLIYAYATGCFSSRKIERGTYDSVACRFIACNSHPDHDTLATFRRRFKAEFEAVFVQVLQVARENRLTQFGRVSLDGSKIHANASRHSALSYGHAEALEAHLKAEVQQLLALAAQTDGESVPDGMSVPAELQRREVRLAAIAQAKAKLEARAAERFAEEQAAYEAKLEARAQRAVVTGRKPGGRVPQPPTPGARPTDQINLTDEESRIMPVAGGGFEQCYNAQAVVDTASLIVMLPWVTQEVNDKQQVVPMLERLQALPADLNQVEQAVADTGYFSANNVAACAQVGIEPLIAMGRDAHHPQWSERFSEPADLPADATPVQRMQHRLKTRKGRAAYALRKQTVEPVFGIIKSVMGFRQFLTRGLDNVQNEWTLVCLAWNLKRMAVLCA
ncbi:IS1182 family transposase [uncultured Lamprocystis sp.]|jgi:transposase|uniref:IS1182 family transposase n=3 Tax=uncultured Lamprocystis sp. TaxID=543132 RepID=UPI0025F57B54|nr:IS1182 family transposase [uncultured Lamprocystis sp.]